MDKYVKRTQRDYSMSFKLNEKEQQKVSFACQLFGVDRQVYYHHLKRRNTRKNNAKQVVAMVTEIRKHSPKMGGRKLYFLLKKLKMLKIGRDKFFNILRANHLLITPILWHYFQFKRFKISFEI